jgi:hypothetical protein
MSLMRKSEKGLLKSSITVLNEISNTTLLNDPREDVKYDKYH